MLPYLYECKDPNSVIQAIAVSPDVITVYHPAEEGAKMIAFEGVNLDHFCQLSGTPYDQLQASYRGHNSPIRELHPKELRSAGASNKIPHLHFLLKGVVNPAELEHLITKLIGLGNKTSERKKRLKETLSLMMKYHGIDINEAASVTLISNSDAEKLKRGYEKYFRENEKMIFASYAEIQKAVAKDREELKIVYRNNRIIGNAIQCLYQAALNPRTSQVVLYGSALSFVTNTLDNVLANTKKLSKDARDLMVIGVYALQLASCNREIFPLLLLAALDYLISRYVNYPPSLIIKAVLIPIIMVVVAMKSEILLKESEVDNLLYSVPATLAGSYAGSYVGELLNRTLFPKPNTVVGSPAASSSTAMKLSSER